MRSIKKGGSKASNHVMAESNPVLCENDASLPNNAIGNGEGLDKLNFYNTTGGAKRKKRRNKRSRKRRLRGGKCKKGHTQFGGSSCGSKKLDQTGGNCKKGHTQFGGSSCGSKKLDQTGGHNKKGHKQFGGSKKRDQTGGGNHNHNEKDLKANVQQGGYSSNAYVKNNCKGGS